MLGGIIKIVSGALQAFNAWMRRDELKEARKDGGRQVDLKQRDKQDDVRKDAKNFRREPKPVTKSGAGDRLRKKKPR